MCGKARRICAWHRDHKLQWQIRASGGASIYDENRHIHGSSGRLRGDCVPFIKIPGYDQRGSEIKAQGIVCKNTRDRGGLGNAQCRKADESLRCPCKEKACKEKILDTFLSFVYDSKGDSNG